MLKKIIVWAIVIFLALYLTTQPSGAANVIHGMVGLLSNAGQSLANFVNGLK